MPRRGDRWRCVLTLTFENLARLQLGDAIAADLNVNHFTATSLIGQLILHRNQQSRCDSLVNSKRTRTRRDRNPITEFPVTFPEFPVTFPVLVIIDGVVGKVFSDRCDD